MIRTKDLVPQYYTNNSRDFQLLEHLLDSIFNTSRTAIIATDPETLYQYDNKFIQLACRTVGFFNRGNYDASTLQAVMKNFKYLVRNKGKLSAIEDAIKILLNAQRITKNYMVLINETNDRLMIYLPTETQSTRLLDELFNYILPTGYTYSIYSQDISLSNSNAQMYLTVNNNTVRFSKEDAVVVKNNENYKYLMGLDVIDLQLDSNNELEVDSSTPSVNTQTISHNIKEVNK